MKTQRVTPAVEIVILSPGTTIFEQGVRYTDAFCIIGGLVRLTYTNPNTNYVQLVGALTDNNIVVPRLNPSATRETRTEPYPCKVVTEQTTQGRFFPLTAIYRMFTHPKTPDDRERIRTAVAHSWELLTKAGRETITGEIQTSRHSITEQIRLLANSGDYEMVAVVGPESPPPRKRRPTSSYRRHGNA